jgi:hypothetical protein
VNKFVALRPWLKHTLGIVHVLVIPIMVAIMAFYIQGLSGAQ